MNQPIHKLAILLFTLLLAACAKAPPKLNVLAYPGMIDPRITAEFEAQFQCKIVIDNIDSPESMIAKLAAGGTALYDIVVPDHASVQPMVQRGLLASLRHENIPNLKNIDPSFTNSLSDPGNRYGAPISWGFIGIYARRSPGQAIDESLAIIFDPSKQPGPFLLFDYSYPCINAALLYKGYKLGTTNLHELAEARDLLIDVKKRFLGFADPVLCRNRVLNKEASFALVTNQDGAVGMKEDPDTYFFVPRGGVDSWFNNLAIPSNAPQRDLAEKFINHLLEAKIAAQNALFSETCTPNRAALELIPAKERGNVALFPSTEIIKILKSPPPVIEQAKLYDEIWTQIKAK